MKIKGGRQDGYEKWLVLKNETEQRPEFVSQVLLIAEQVEAWITEDGLTEDQAFGRMLRDKPELRNKLRPTSIDTVWALNEFWEYGEQFNAYIEADIKGEHDKPSAEKTETPNE